MFRKLFVTIFTICLIATPAIAQHNLGNAKASNDSVSLILSNPNEVLYTKSVPVTRAVNDSIGVMYRQSPATADTTFEVQQSYESPSTGEGVADADFITTETFTTPLNGNWHIATIDTVAMPYLRFKLTGGATNVTANIKVFKP